MIYAQSFADLGCPKGYIPKGFFMHEGEMTDAQGYGIQPNIAVPLFVEAVQKQLGDDHLFGAKLTLLPGSAHPDYRRQLYRITGDRYAETEEAKRIRESFAGGLPGPGSGNSNKVPGYRQAPSNVRDLG